MSAGDGPRLAELRMAARMGVIMHLQRGWSHDLKGPLNALALNLELLRRSFDAPESTEPGSRRKQWARVLGEELERLERFGERLFTLLAPRAGGEATFDLGELLREVEASVAPQARQQEVELAVAPPAAAVAVTARRDRIELALLSLAVNALEAMPEGGRLAFEVSEDAEGEAAVRISDSRPGVPAEQRERIFEMHFTTKQEASGLGLYVARADVEAEGGSIALLPGTEGGATFELRLPRESGEA